MTNDMSVDVNDKSPRSVLKDSCPEEIHKFLRKIGGLFY